MGETYSIQSDSDTVRLIQLTDPHLFASKDQTLLGINTDRSFQAVMQQIQQTDFVYDAVLATGDIVQDQNAVGYRRFAELSKSLNKPIFWIEGNHDCQPEMSQTFAEYTHILPMKQILAGSKWQILLLNSRVANVPYGELSQIQLHWLSEKLAEQPERFSLIVLHHNILPTDSAWLDQHSLRNCDALADVLAAFPKVKAILHGHIHQAVDQLWKNYRVLATPSTCIQFKPNCHDFTLDEQPQGWRELTLHANGTIETAVKRLDSLEFLPNFLATGY